MKVYIEPAAVLFEQPIVLQTLLDKAILAKCNLVSQA